DRLRDLLLHMSGSDEPSDDCVPFVADYVREVVEVDGIERRETERPRIIDRIEDPEILRTILQTMDSGYRFVSVAAVDEAGPAEVYSVRVQSADHSFLAGG